MSTPAISSRPSTPNYYEVLGVAPDASPQTLRQAYKKKALSSHPDRCSSRQGGSRPGTTGTNPSTRVSTPAAVGGGAGGSVADTSLLPPPSRTRSRGTRIGTGGGSATTTTSVCGGEGFFSTSEPECFDTIDTSPYGGAGDQSEGYDDEDAFPRTEREATEQFQLIGEAYAVLADSDKRLQYDNEFGFSDIGGGGGGPDGGGDSDSDSDGDGGADVDEAFLFRLNGGGSVPSAFSHVPTEFRVPTPDTTTFVPRKRTASISSSTVDPDTKRGRRRSTPLTNSTSGRKTHSQAAGSHLQQPPRSTAPYGRECSGDVQEDLQSVFSAVLSNGASPSVLSRKQKSKNAFNGSEESDDATERLSRPGYASSRASKRSHTTQKDKTNTTPTTTNSSGSSAGGSTPAPTGAAFSRRAFTSMDSYLPEVTSTSFDFTPVPTRQTTSAWGSRTQTPHRSEIAYDQDRSAAVQSKWDRTFFFSNDGKVKRRDDVSRRFHKGKGGRMGQRATTLDGGGGADKAHSNVTSSPSWLDDPRQQSNVGYHNQPRRRDHNRSCPSPVTTSTSSATSTAAPNALPSPFHHGRSVGGAKAGEWATRQVESRAGAGSQWRERFRSQKKATTQPLPRTQTAAAASPNKQLDPSNTEQSFSPPPRSLRTAGRAASHASPSAVVSKKAERIAEARRQTQQLFFS